MAHIEGPDQVDGALHKLVLKSLDDDLAQEIVTIDLAGKSLPKGSCSGHFP